MNLAPHPLLARFQSITAALPKHVRLRTALIDAVESGELPAGTKLTGERELSEALGISLGTTQKALGQLVGDGFLVRKHGHGTFVSSSRQPVSGSWHYRFLDQDGVTEMPVFTTVVDRRLLTDAGPWNAALGEDPKGYVMLVRRLDVAGRFECSSRMYLGATRFGRLLRIAEKKLVDTNLKSLLESDFAAPTLRSDGVAHVVKPDKEDVKLLRIAPAAWGLRVLITGYSFGRAPISYQRMFVPPTEYGLKLDFNPPERQLAKLR